MFCTKPKRVDGHIANATIFNKAANLVDTILIPIGQEEDTGSALSRTVFLTAFSIQNLDASLKAGLDICAFFGFQPFEYLVSPYPLLSDRS